MNKCRPSSPASSRFLSSCLAVLAACVLLAPAAAYATPYVIKLKQQGPNVVATGSGAFDLTGLQLWNQGGYRLTYSAWLNPSAANFSLDLGSNQRSIDLYSGVMLGPSNVGSGGASIGSGNGDPVAFDLSDLFVPTGYSSGSPLSNSAIWDNASFASLGVTPGTYVWTWGTGAEQSFTLDVAVPEPAALGMFGLGLLLIGGFVGLRRRVA